MRHFLVPSKCNPYSVGVGSLLTVRYRFESWPLLCIFPGLAGGKGCYGYGKPKQKAVILAYFKKNSILFNYNIYFYNFSNIIWRDGNKFGVLINANLVEAEPKILGEIF